MPNRRGSVQLGALEEAHPWRVGRFAEAEPQERRGAPGSRDVGGSIAERSSQPAGPRRGREQGRSAAEWTGVNPLEPIDPSMPYAKPGDQAG